MAICSCYLRINPLIGGTKTKSRVYVKVNSSESGPAHAPNSDISSYKPSPKCSIIVVTIFVKIDHSAQILHIVLVSRCSALVATAHTILELHGLGMSA